MKNIKYENQIQSSKIFSKYATYGNLPIPKNRLFLTPSLIGMSDVLCFRYGSHVYRLFWQDLSMAYWEECERLAIKECPPPPKCQPNLDDENWRAWDEKIFALTHDMPEKHNLIIRPSCVIKQSYSGKIIKMSLPNKEIAPETVYEMALSILKREKTMLDYFPDVVYTKEDFFSEPSQAA